MQALVCETSYHTSQTGTGHAPHDDIMHRGSDHLCCTSDRHNRGEAGRLLSVLKHSSIYCIVLWLGGIINHGPDILLWLHPSRKISDRIWSTSASIAKSGLVSKQTQYQEIQGYI